MDSKALQKLSYGVYVVGSRKDGKMNGQIANTVSQAASDPALVTVAINKGNLTHEYIKAGKVFTVSVLNETAPLPYIGGLGFKSGHDTDKMVNVGYQVGQTGAPYFTDHTAAYLEAEVIGEMDAVTHTIFLGKVVNCGVLSDQPVMTYDFYHKVKRGVTPKSAPSYAPKDK